MANPIQEAFMQIPLLTRAFMSACILTTLACQLDLVSPFQLYFSIDRIFKNYEFWRLFANFFYFGNFGIDLFFHMFFLVRYSRMLEEGSYRGRTADFLVLLVYGMVFMLIAGSFCDLLFLGQPLTFMLVYIWGRRNPLVRLSFFGLVQFNASSLAYVLVGLSFVMGHNVIPDLLGIAAGHLYYFLEDVYAAPPPRGLGGPRVFAAPQWLANAMEEMDADVPPPPADERPGGFAWGM
eukprot:m.71305 g.71305  ORF g.71305 m.71305 type:complete len:236 (+) comp12937_c1_seq2:831-1538(+)